MRKMRDMTGRVYEVEIQRVRCLDCKEGRTHSLIYDFLIPYCRSSAEAVELAVREYVCEPSTYLSALNEAVSEAAVLFGAVEKMLFQLPAVWMQLVRTLIAAGYSVDEILKEGSSPNSLKCRKKNKQEMLDWSAQLLELVPDIFRIANQNGYSLFSSGRGCKLLRTQSPECRLF